ncbi:aminotransferase class V-fold PLP-dependent enzyme [Chromohalobacter sp. HP20-39]|uniref:aminotransferase class V-fold PLP-dependent enzyme n=1 Tax=Chromohalobacter sp. HP20-39 TaxID=3079306 RepID=UPI00294B0D98|nr:aminotransferase class V-fold PLP-dependent enzyme [Chromohalobacter sp. HP20-39]MDV6320561.1 aminotransferase class V-fold PLP-dependent enzyme [Chromohalobacter sp. HP20-39]
MAMTDAAHAVHDSPHGASSATCGQAISLPPRLLRQVRGHFYYVDHCPIDGKRIHLNGVGEPLALKAAVQMNAELASMPVPLEANAPGHHVQAMLTTHGWEDLAIWLGASLEASLGVPSRSSLADSRSQLWRAPSTAQCWVQVLALALGAAPRGSHVVTTALASTEEATAIALHARQQALSSATVPVNPLTGRLEVAEYAHCVTPETRVATLVHTCPFTGMRQDVAAIARAIRKVAPACFILVMGEHHAAHAPLAVAHWEVDAYVVGAEAIFCRPRQGFAWLSRRLSLAMRGAMPSTMPSTMPSNLIPPHSGEEPTALASMTEWVAYLDWLGRHFTGTPPRCSRVVAAGEAIQAHERALLNRLLHGFPEAPKTPEASASPTSLWRCGLHGHARVRVIGAPHALWRDGTVAFHVQGIEAWKVVQWLAATGIAAQLLASPQAVRALAPFGYTAATRLSVSHYNSEAEIEICLQTLDPLLERPAEGWG